ncbi:MAG: S-layer homology domain-containing protein [Clostridia bacterium]|nr:S-layer homology domain-containing protein [Clostridia bacterium]
MKINQRILAVILVLLMLIPTMTAVANAAAPGTYVVSTGTLNVRAAATTNSAVIGKVYRDQRVDITEINGNWGKITLNSKSGWISLDYVVPVSANTKQFSVGPDGLAMIKKLEGYRQYKYWDYNHYSIGYGTTCGADDYPEGISEPDASALLVQALAKHEVYLDNFLARHSIKVSQKQYDALVSFTYNLGDPWSRYDSFKLKDLLIDGAEKYKPEAVKDAFLEFKKAGGQVVSGLIYRRGLESSMFIEGTPKLGRPFYDVKSYNWFYNAVNFCYNKGVMSGTSSLKYSFDPYSNLTRAQMVTMLAQLGNINIKPYTTSSFSDVKVGSWYAPYVQWAYAKGIVSGTGNGKFSPNAPVSRQDMVVMLYNFTRVTRGVPSNISTELYKSFGDASQLASYAYNAMNWALHTGCISGSNDNKLNPKTTAQRAQVAQVANMYCVNILGIK